jgi:hypothetical protein
MTGTAPTALPARHSEAMLLEFARELYNRRAGRRATWLHLSRLNAHKRRDHHVRTAASAFRALVDARTAQVFVLADADIVVVYEGDSHDQVRREVTKVSLLFADEAVATEDPTHPCFVTWYDLKRDYECFLNTVRARFEGRSSPDAPVPRATLPMGLVKRQRSGDELTPAQLERIERGLAGADLSSLLRRQTVCAVAPDLAVAPRFTELFVAIDELRDTVLPEGDLAANPWLFRRLTETLDRRVLAYLTAAGSRLTDAGISVNVNVSTLLSEAFAALDGGSAGAGPSQVAFELQSVDIFSDISAFLFARDFAHRKGFRVFLDGIRWRDLDVVRAGQLQVDLVKVLWDPAFLEPRSAARDGVARLVEEIGADRIVICRVDGRGAVAAGHAMGLGLFQGYFIDGLLREDRRRRTLQRLKRARRRDT